MALTDSIHDLRQQIDQVDQDMTALFEKRMSLALAIARYKAKEHLPVYDHQREQQVIEKNIGYLSDPDLAAELEDFYQKLMDISKDIQNRHLTT